MLLDEFFKKFIQDLVMRTRVKIGNHTFLLLRQSLISFLKEVVARVVADVIIRLISVVVTCLSYQKCFKLLFVNLLGLVTDFY
jgi:hypothetical protein